MGNSILYFATFPNFPTQFYKKDSAQVTFPPCPPLERSERAGGRVPGPVRGSDRGHIWAGLHPPVHPQTLPGLLQTPPGPLSDQTPRLSGSGRCLL